MKLTQMTHYTGVFFMRELYIKQKVFSLGEKFTVKDDQENDVYFVEAPWLLKILQRTDLDDYESLQYFQRILISSGIIDALRERGICEGDTVSIYDLEFDFVN